MLMVLETLGACLLGGGVEWSPFPVEPEEEGFEGVVDKGVEEDESFLKTLAGVGESVGELEVGREEGSDTFGCRLRVGSGSGS